MLAIHSFRASLPEGGVVLAVASQAATQSLDTGEMGDSSRVETAVIAKDLRSATFLVAPLTIGRQYLRSWSSCIEAVSVSKPLVELSMD